MSDVEKTPNVSSVTWYSRPIQCHVNHNCNTLLQLLQRDSIAESEHEEEEATESGCSSNEVSESEDDSESSSSLTTPSYTVREERVQEDNRDSRRYLP